MFVLVDRPHRAKLSDLEEANAQIAQQIQAKNEQLKGYKDMKAAADEADLRAKAINRLMSAKVVPANVLHELGEIVTPGHLPTMTEEIARKTGNGPQSDPNRRFDLAWDPTKVWITSFTDSAKDGSFRLEGNAATQGDIVQLSKRLQASAYFEDASQALEERQIDRETGITFYKFVITGKVAY
jgi:hypothetical protein